MSEWMIPLTFFVGGVMMIVMALGLWIAVIIPGVDRWSRRFFEIFFALLTLCMGICFVDAMVYEKPELILAERVVTYFEYLLASAVIPMLTAYLLRCCGEKLRGNPLFRAVLCLWCAYFAMLIIAQFNDSFYYVTARNQFYRGPWHPLLLAPIIAIMLLNLTHLIRKRDKLSRRYYGAFLVYLIPLMAALIVHMFVYAPLFVDIGIAICALSMFGVILMDHIDRYLRQQRQIAHQRASIMVLQMRPHFIHNTMTSIYYLCGQDPRKAQQVTLDFNTYLRRNFTAIASDHTIPFAKELEHTQAYLAVEQAQFEDDLLVDYDTPHTAFRLPPLTLQPIVENAVKHGMDPDSEPLRIRVSTRLTERGSEVVVEDNGPGYEPAGDDESHIALANIRQRLDMMCGGELTITPLTGGGTRVRVTIPPQGA